MFERRKSTLVVVNIGDVVERNNEIKSIKDRQPEQIHEGQWEMVCCVRRQAKQVRDHVLNWRGRGPTNNK